MTEQKYLKNTTLILEDRNLLTLTGVEKVISFSPNEIMLVCLNTNLHIQGEQMHTEKLDIENGEFKVEGIINSIKWETKQEKLPLFKRIFK